MNFDLNLLNVFILICVCVPLLTLVDIIINAIKDNKREEE